ncbi:hypothetical protein F4677DRAFT_369084 [Hypoxylon crocopeplum]|nr:hypothetical protein F4677DRAFT_369084 [Hypoxylon crocopeplum]
MQVLPFFQTRDLPPSASFYAAVTQPLGLRYISADSSSILFGDTTSPTPEPVFEVKKSIGVDDQPVQPCRLILSANSPSAVSAFHAAALRAHPDLQDGDANSNYLHLADSSDSSGESRARIGDFDGNIMEVIYANPGGYAASQAGSTTRHGQSSSQEVSRVLDWNLDVGATPVPKRSVAGSVAASSTVGSRAANGEPYSFLQKSVTTSTVETSPRENSKGLSASAVVGTVLGVAVGAAVGGALTYSMMKNERDRVAFQGDMPPFSRRATYPDQYSDAQPRYYPPATYVGGYSQAGGPRSRVMEEIDDRASRHSGHHTTGSKSRGRSEAASTRRPLMITDHEHRSNASSKHSDSPRLLMDTEYRSQVGSQHTADHRSQAGSRYTTASSRHSTESDYRSYVGSKHGAPRPHGAEVETYVSGRSDRSAATIRPSHPLATVETAPPSRAPSKAGSRYSSATVRPAGVSRTQSHGVARNIPLPESTVGSRNGWEDDACSVAPSDSISNIGSRQGKRSQRA